MTPSKRDPPAPQLRRRERHEAGLREREGDEEERVEPRRVEVADRPGAVGDREQADHAIRASGRRTVWTAISATAITPAARRSVFAPVNRNTTQAVEE